MQTIQNRNKIIYTNKKADLCESFLFLLNNSFSKLQIYLDGPKSHRSGVMSPFGTSLTSPCWVRRLAGCYMTYTSCQVVLFLSGHLLWSWLWVSSKYRLCPPTLPSTCTTRRWQLTACCKWSPPHTHPTHPQSADMTFVCPAIFSWFGILQGCLATTIV